MKQKLGITTNHQARDATGVYESPGGVEVFETDAPYLLSDGASLMPPLPVIVIDGPVYADTLGNAQTAIAVTGLGPPPPQGITWDENETWDNGTYWS
jgi:hypothetical protein